MEDTATESKAEIKLKPTLTYANLDYNTECDTCHKRKTKELTYGLQENVYRGECPDCGVEADLLKLSLQYEQFLAFHERKSDPDQVRFRHEAKAEGITGPTNLKQALETSKEKPHLITGLLPSNGFFICTAPKGAGKTSLAIHMAVCVAMGLPFSPIHPVRKSGNVLLMLGEGVEDTKVLIKAYVWNKWGKDVPSELWNNLNLREGPTDLTENIDKVLSKFDFQYKLVIVDSAQAFSPEGSSSNSNQDMLKYAKAFGKMKDFTKGTVFVLAHPPKASTSAFEPYGAGSFSNESSGLCWIKTKGNRSTLIINEKWRGKHWKSVEFKRVIVEDCPALIATEDLGDGTVYTEQHNAPVLVPLEASESPLSQIEWYVNLGKTQKLIVNVLAGTVKEEGAGEMHQEELVSAAVELKGDKDCNQRILKKGIKAAAQGLADATETREPILYYDDVDKVYSFHSEELAQEACSLLRYHKSKS